VCQVWWGAPRSIPGNRLQPLGDEPGDVERGTSRLNAEQGMLVVDCVLCTCQAERFLTEKAIPFRRDGLLR
jgi:hypothetical protein